MDDNFASFLLWFGTSGGAGLVGFWFVEKLKENWPWFAGLTGEIKWYASLAITAFLAMGAHFLEVGFEYQPIPVGWKGWVEALFSVAFVSIVAATSVYRRKMASA